MSGIPAGAGSLLGKRLGKFEILALLALGGTAEIYLARIAGAAGFEKYVVVKCLHDHLADDAEFVKMFLDEARLAAHLDHSNIVQTMELGEYENRYYMVMEFLAGLSLAMVVRRAGERLQGGRIPVPLVLNIIAQSCAGLHYAHERNVNGKALNIVHRDISPQNLVVSFEGVVKVVDFGIAKAELRETRTRSGTIKGKFAYMSPEQCVANNVDRRTDVFALGVIAHELLTGRRLFKKPSPYETYQAVIECNVDPPSRGNVEIDPALDPIIMRAVAKDKEARYPTAEAFGDAILGYLHHRGKGSGPGDVARFFDQNFAQEIEEHGARMRELISGRSEVALEASAQWSDEDEAKRNETVDFRKASGPLGDGAEQSLSLDLDTKDLEEIESPGFAGARSAAEGRRGDLIERPSVDGLSGVIDDLAAPADGDDDLPNERTRIEANPLETGEEAAIVEEPAAIITNKPVDMEDRHPKMITSLRPPSRKPTPLPAMVPTVVAPQSEPSRPQQHKMPPSGPLPLPPMPSGPNPAASSNKFPEFANLPTMVAEEEAPDSPELARTAIGSVDPRLADAPVDPHARTSMDMTPPNLNGARPAIPPRNGAPAAHAHPMAGVAMAPMPDSGPPPMQMGSGPQPMQPMQMPPGTGPQPMQPPPQMMSYPVVNKQMSDQMRQGATVYPSNYDPSRAAEMASPVGQYYPGQVDWAAAASKPARAIPPWLLAVLFVGAVGAALLVTFILVKIIR